MNHEEMKPIYELMAEYPDPTEDQIRDMAEGLLLYRAMREVRSEVSRIKGERTYAERTAGMQWYPLLAPLPNGGKNIIVSDGPDEQVIQKPVRTQINVRIKDLPSFCKLHKLDVKAMREASKTVRVVATFTEPPTFFDPDLAE
jgi:hypothetical protein